jgi:hypothetical protein
MNKEIEKKNPILAAYLNLVLPGLGCQYLRKWKYAILFFFWTPLRLILGIIVFNGVYSYIFRETKSEIGTTIGLLITYIWWAIVMWDTVNTPYKMALENNQEKTKPPNPLVEPT